MSATTWSKFFWADWESDERLKLCSPAAQALWMRMLCVCVKSDGYLTINGQKLDQADMASLTGWPAADIESWWAELAKWGVFSVDGRGRTFSRRMVRDEKKAKTARENGRNGGNPSLRKDRENSSSDNQDVTEDGGNDPTDLSGTRAGINHLPLAKKETVSKETDAEASRPDGLFEDDDPLADLAALPVAKGCWRLATLVLTERGRMAEAKARSFIGRLKGGGLTDDDLWEIAEAAWKLGTQDPAAYLTKAAEGVIERRGGGLGITDPSEKQQRAWAEDWRDKGPGGWKTWERGPCPGEPGCRVSPAIIAEFTREGVAA